MFFFQQLPILAFVLVCSIYHAIVLQSSHFLLCNLYDFWTWPFLKGILHLNVNDLISFSSHFLPSEHASSVWILAFLGHIVILHVQISSNAFCKEHKLLCYPWDFYVICNARNNIFILLSNHCFHLYR